MPMNQRGQNLNSTQLSAELDFYLFWIIYECLRPNQFSTAKAKSFASPKKKDPTTYGQSMGSFESRQSSPNHESQFAIAKEPQNKHTAEPPTHTHTQRVAAPPPLPLSFLGVPLSLSSFLFEANSVNVSGDKDVNDAIAARCLVNVINRKSFCSFFQVNLKHILRLRY